MDTALRRASQQDENAGAGEGSACACVTGQLELLAVRGQRGERHRGQGAVVILCRPAQANTLAVTHVCEPSLNMNTFHPSRSRVEYWLEVPFRRRSIPPPVPFCTKVSARMNRVHVPA